MRGDPAVMVVSQAKDSSSANGKGLVQTQAYESDKQCKV